MFDIHTCMTKMFFQHERAKNWSTKNDVLPNIVALNAHKKYLFDCDVCGHEFVQSPNCIVSLKRWCPYCTNQKLCSADDCITCFNKSFASHEFAHHWIDDLNDRKPRDVLLGTNKKFWFKCHKCNHKFEKQLKRIKATNGWCYYCSSDVLCDDDDCGHCFNKSLASDPRINMFISSESGKDARHVVKKGKEKCIFKCADCEHFFPMMAANFSTLKHQCGFCLSKRWCDGECAACDLVSFATHEKANYATDEIDFSRVRRSSKDKYMFKCEKCSFVFSKTICDVCRGSWCPTCINKTEKKLIDVLDSMYDDVIFQPRYDWCKSTTTDKFYPFDYCIPSKHIIIELDGEQHFKNVLKWLPCDDQRARDIYKTKKANNEGYSTIRVLQTDVLGDKHNWKRVLISAVEKIDSNDVVENIYISAGDIYSRHIEEFGKYKSIKNITMR